jgi:hypothetical protein
MNKKLNIFTTALLLSAMIFSCKKDGIHEITTSTADNAAQIKFYNFAINSPSLNFYANDAKISATSSVTGIEAPTGVAYGSIFPASNYSFLTGGAYTFKGVTPALATTDPNVVVATLPSTLVNRKFYSMYTCGFYNTTAKTTDAFIIEDQIPEASATSASVRFVNTIPNATSGFDLIVKNTTTLTEQVVAKNIAYKGASDFISVPNGVYEIYARYSNGTVNIITRNGTSVVSFIYGRTYTVSSRGDITVTGTTATNRPFLDVTSNRP